MFKTFFKYKVNIFKDKEDLRFVISNDKIINITGLMGSGKTTLARDLKKENNYELISLDWMFGASLKNRPKYIENLCDIFLKNHPLIDTNKEYYKHADEIYNFLLKNIYKPTIFEGRHIYMYMNQKVLKGILIIKRTSLLKSYKNAFKRDMSNKINEYKNKEIKIKTILNRFFERIKIPISDYIKVNKYITKIVKIYEIK